MKKLTVILLSAILLLTACCLSSCDLPIEAADSETLRADPGAAPAEQIADLTDGREIIEVYIPSASVTQSIRPLFDYGNGVIRSERPGGDRSATAYPVTVEFHGDFVKVNYYVATETSVAQRSLITGKDNVIIYLK